MHYAVVGMHVTFLCEVPIVIHPTMADTQVLSIAGFTRFTKHYFKPCGSFVSSFCAMDGTNRTENNLGRSFYWLTKIKKMVFGF